MINIKNYNDYIIDILFEGSNNGLLPFRFSRKFEDIILSINHPISKDILSMDINNTSVTLIDITDENDKVSMVNSPKLIEYISKKIDNNTVTNINFFKELRDPEIWTKNRTIIKIGKLIKKIFGDKYVDNGKPGEDIESFVNMYKSIFDGDSNLMDIVEGDDIIYWYDYENYTTNISDTTLHKSCMSDVECSDYLDFYSINKDKVKLLIKYEDDTKNKIVARSLIWYLDNPSGRIFMDRVYYTYDSQVDEFINYATKNKWLYKKRDGYIVDTINNNIYSNIHLSINNIKLNRYYPYLDTLNYLYQDNHILSNNILNIDDDYARLLGTEGRPINLNWSNYYNKYINEYNEKYVKCLIGNEDIIDEDEMGYVLVDEYRLKEDALYLPYYGDYIPKDFLNTHKLVDVTIGGNYKVLEEDAVWVEKYNTYALKSWSGK